MKTLLLRLHRLARLRQVSAPDVIIDQEIRLIGEGVRCLTSDELARALLALDEACGGH